MLYFNKLASYLPIVSTAMALGFSIYGYALDDIQTSTGAGQQGQVLPVIRNANNFAIAFSRANAEKFKNEIIEVKGLALGTKITLNLKPDLEDALFGDTTYDPEKAEMVFSNPHGGSSSPVEIIKYLESCKTNGSSFLGQNTYGAKTMVRRKTCERFFVDDIDDDRGADDQEIRVKMSPSQFRSITKNGVRNEVDFIIDQPKNGTVVTFGESWNKATINDPVESHIKVWMLYGHIVALRWFLPGEKESVKVWSR